MLSRNDEKNDQIENSCKRRRSRDEKFSKLQDRCASEIRFLRNFSSSSGLPTVTMLAIMNKLYVFSYYYGSQRQFPLLMEEEIFLRGREREGVNFL